MVFELSSYLSPQIFLDFSNICFDIYDYPSFEAMLCTVSEMSVVFSD
jgi:hypothetical protein